MEPPTKSQIDAYLTRLKNLHVPSGIPGVTMVNLKASPPGPDPRIKIDSKMKICALFYRYEYQIDLNEIKSEKDLLWWVHHLCEKNWITSTIIEELIERISAFKKFKMYG